MQSVPGVTKIKEGYNPATWMLEVSTSAVEAQLDIDFAEVFANSALYRSVINKIETFRPAYFWQSISLPAPFLCEYVDVSILIVPSIFLFHLFQEKSGSY